MRLRLPFSRCRGRLVSLAVLISVSCSLARAADLDDEFTVPDPWINSYEGKLWSGYKDNVLLSRHNQVQSGLSGAGADLTFYRLPVDGWQFLFLLSGEYVRYWDAPDVDQEANLIAQAQAKKAFAQSWTAGLSLEYVYFNQVFDASILEDRLSPLQVEAHTLTVSPSVSRKLGNSSRLEIGWPATRELFAQFLDDYWEFGPKFTWTKDIGSGTELSLSYQFTDRLHDTRETRNARGDLQEGDGLRFEQHDFVATWRHTWDNARRWRSTTRLSARRNEDNGGGFYDYLRPQISEQLRYRDHSWEAQAEVRLAYYHYDRERIGSADSPLREKTYLTVQARLERHLTKTIKIFAQYEWERAFSNLQIDAYEVNTGVAGLSCEF